MLVRERKGKGKGTGTAKAFEGDALGFKVGAEGGVLG